MSKAQQSFWTGRKRITLRCERCGKETEMIEKSSLGCGASFLTFVLGLILLALFWPLGVAVICASVLVPFFGGHYWTCTECETMIRKS